MADQFDVMRVELRAKAKLKALEVSRKTGKSPNYLTNMLWESLTIFELEELVKLSFEGKNEKGETKNLSVRRPIKITVRL
jgi:hypothetical protein